MARSMHDRTSLPERMAERRGLCAVRFLREGMAGENGAACPGHGTFPRRPAGSRRQCIRRAKICREKGGECPYRLFRERERPQDACAAGKPVQLLAQFAQQIVLRVEE